MSTSAQPRTAPPVPAPRNSVSATKDPTRHAINRGPVVLDDHDVTDDVLLRTAVAQHPDDDAVIRVYHYAAQAGELTAGSFDVVALQLGLPLLQVFAAVTRLVELRMLRTDGEAGDRLVVTDPQVAATLLVSPIEREICQRRALADQLRERIAAISRPRDGLPQPISAIDSFVGGAEVSGLLKLAADICQEELLLLCPAGAGEDEVDELLEGALMAVAAGVRVRLIAPHRSRAGYASRARAKRLISDGAELRTVSHVNQACVILDRTLAVVLGGTREGEPMTARRIRDAEVVACLGDLFDQLWDGAAPFVTEEPGYAEDVADDLQRSIAGMMAQGLTDEVVARRLGMSVRTCRRHIAALLRNLDSVSRFQAGVQAARRLASEEALGA